MTTMIAEVYDAFVAAGTPEEKARRASEAVAAFETRFSDLGGRIDRVEGRLNTVVWMCGINVTIGLLVLGKLLAFPLH